MKKKKLSLQKKLMIGKSAIASLTEQQKSSAEAISYHTFINCDLEARRNGQLC
ncbi:MAG TPA: class I lanthipeptide [Chitinophaga sp.]|uniref:class I lanthipeptide n=1 Tax=Chitinophaga sp. TaxID=1869181 RepID=UPI002C21D2A8|nr:class I lanthipeptide [Chitinophaga sp.]HVI44968.1 class I lanthipeptide [Chitinophaga sp.]